MGTNEPGDSGDDRLDEIGRRIDSVRDHNRQAAHTQPSPLGIAWRISTELVAAVFVGAGIGIGVDWLTGWRPVGMIVFLAVGIATGFYNVFRAARELNAAQQDKEEK